MGKRQQRLQPEKKTKKQNAFSLLLESFRDLRRGFEYDKPSARKPQAKSRSFAPRTLSRYEENMAAIGLDGEYIMSREKFYDAVVGTSPYYQGVVKDDQPLLSTRKRGESTRQQSRTKAHRSILKKSASVEPANSTGFRCSGTKCATVSREAAPVVMAAGAPSTSSRRRTAEDETPMVTGDEDETDLDFVPDWLEGVFDNSDRHSLGMGFLSSVFGSGQATKTVGYDEDRDSRPFFTYWITLVQFIVFIVVIATYGVGPISPSTSTKSELVLMTNLVQEQQSYEEIGNMWIGPRQQDLIHVGAKYSLCMRSDTNLQNLVDQDKLTEKQLACCDNNDGSGCVMRGQTACNNFISTWLKYGASYPPIQSGRTSGAVCGQDPDYCNDTYTNWPDDISQWPTCQQTSAVVANSDPTTRHMRCEVLGRPCCVGIQGECVLATREYCTFRRGFFHESATLCSQVQCMGDICGMIPFANSTQPDQFYRLFSNMFLHAGIFDLIVTLLIQLIFMRDLEKLISTWRVVIIYVGSGIAGSLASATFIPYYVEAGPSGAQFGIIAALFIEVLRFERRVKNSQIWKTLLKMFIAIVILFIIGLIFPQVDNYSHLFGLFFGGLIAFGLRPYNLMCGRKLDKDCAGITIKVVIAIACILLASGVFVITVILFYVSPVYDCTNCMYFNCIPFTSTYCSGMSVTLARQVTTG